MAKYANQINITIGSREARDAKHPYSKMSIAAIQQALQNIRTIGGMKLWLYLNKNVDSYNLDLSRAELVAHQGFTKDTYLSGKKELIELGYLTPINGSETKMIFHEIPLSEK